VDRDEKIRERAYHLWLDEGMPEGRETDHWELASELVAIEENSTLMLKPNPLQPGEEIMPDEPGEPLEVEQNLGEFPTLTDQGEEQTVPSLAPAEAPSALGEPAATEIESESDKKPARRPTAPASRRRAPRTAKAKAV
jgi:hypothetical protein